MDPFNSVAAPNCRGIWFPARAHGKTLAVLTTFAISFPAFAEEKGAIHDLGTTSDPPAASAVVWKATTSMRNGAFSGLVRGKPGESQIETTETRELKTVYVSATERQVTVINSKSTQSETVAGDMQKSETNSALAGIPLRATLRDGRWRLEIPESTESKPQQRAELQKLEARLNAPANLFDRIKARVGEKFSVDPLRFVKQSGFADAVKASGKVEGTIREIVDRGGEPAAVIVLDVAVQATLQEPDGPRRSLNLDGKGTFVHSLRSGLDLSVGLTAKLKTSGLMLAAPGSFAPFAFDADLKFDSTREIVKP